MVRAASHPEDRGVRNLVVKTGASDDFRDQGATWPCEPRPALKVMSTIERCRTAALGGHVARCQECSYTTHYLQQLPQPHCPKCQGAAAKRGSQSARRSCCPWF